MAEHMPKCPIVVHPLFAGSPTMQFGWTIMVTGTSFRQPALHNLADLLKGQDSKEFSAQLIADKENPHDPLAVAVFAGEAHIGYLAKDYLTQKTGKGVRGKVLHQEIGFLEMEGHPAVASAKLIGGPPHKSYGVRVRTNGFRDGRFAAEYKPKYASGGAFTKKPSGSDPFFPLEGEIYPGNIAFNLSTEPVISNTWNWSHTVTYTHNQVEGFWNILKGTTS